MAKLNKAPFHLIELIRRHNAMTAITASAAHGQVRKGDTQHVRDFLDQLDIKSFAQPRNFSRSLDRATKALAKKLPKGGWGSARKFLNLYLRRITYNFYLRRAYHLDRIEPLLELPMDKYAAKGLTRDYQGRLPKWPRVTHLTPEVNAAYQEAAKHVAKAYSRDIGADICRVHLDMKFFRAKPASRRE
jgi:hypothetical protein